MTLKNKKILVTGGSGSLGKILIKGLLNYPVREIVSLSRDEELIKLAEQEVRSPKVHFEMGDICDAEKVERVLRDVDFVYHTAALKHVSLAEKFPREVLRVNILGLLNLLRQSRNVARFIYISSDKAIAPSNCYGASKLFAEYLIRETNGIYKGKFFNIRCPNMLGSRGSVINLWKKQIEEKNSISITDPRMTRYFITLPDASKFIIETSLKTPINPLEYFYPRVGVRKFRLGDLAKAFIGIFGNSQTKIETIGAYPGEKLYEDYLCESKLVTVGKLKEILKSLAQ